MQILGLSTDPRAANAAFAAKYGFPFPLLSDVTRRVCVAYGACDDTAAGRARRVTFVVGPDGRILRVYEDIDVVRHAETLLSFFTGRREDKAYVVGRIGYDFGTEARRSSFVEQGLATPEEPSALLAHLDAHPRSAAALIWTVEQETLPVAAIRPAGAFAGEVHARLRELLGRQLASGDDQVGVAGRIAGSALLLRRGKVPGLLVEPRGLRSWSLSRLTARLLAEVRGPGRSPRERALGFAATAAVETVRIYSSAVAAGLALQGFSARRSSLCRPGSDCWDVELTFFHPRRRLEQAREIYRFTVDVSDVVPVTLGRVRHWQA